MRLGGPGERVRRRSGGRGQATPSGLLQNGWAPQLLVLKSSATMPTSPGAFGRCIPSPEVPQLAAGEALAAHAHAMTDAASDGSLFDPPVTRPRRAEQATRRDPARHRLPPSDASGRGAWKRPPCAHCSPRPAATIMPCLPRLLPRRIRQGFLDLPDEHRPHWDPSLPTDRSRPPSAAEPCAASEATGVRASGDEHPALPLRQRPIAATASVRPP